MGTKIGMVNHTDEGRVTLDAIYKKDDQKPAYIMIEDYRVDSSPVKMRLEYDSRTEQLGLTHVDGVKSDNESVDNMIDEDIWILIEELYNGSVELERWRSIDQVVIYARNRIGKVTDSIGSIIRSRSGNFF